MATTRYFICLIAKGKGPECRYLMCGKATGYKSTSALLAAPYASRHDVDTVYIAGRALYNLLSLWASSNPHRLPSTPKSVLSHGYRKSHHGAPLLYMYTALHSQIPGLGERNRAWTAPHPEGCTWQNFFLSSCPPRAPMGVFHQPGSVCRASSCVPLFNYTYLHRIPFSHQDRISTYTGRPLRFLSQRPVTPRLFPIRIDLMDAHHIINDKRPWCFEGLLYHRPLPSPLLELANLASRLALAFCSLGMCTSSNTANAFLKTWTYPRYATICGSLAWYSSVTWPVTSWESLFTSRPRAPISLARSIPAMRASYSTWLLLDLKANLRAYSINNPFGPSKITPTPLPYWLEDPSTESTHLKLTSSSSRVPLEDSSTTKSAYTWPLTGPQGSY